MSERPDAPTPDPASNPYAPPQSPLLQEPAFEEDGALRPVPFEDLEALPGFWARIGAMFSLVFRRPMELMDRVPVTEGLTAPWRFNLLLSLPHLVLMGLMMTFIFGMAGLSAPREPNLPPHLLAGILGGEFALIAVLLVFGMFISGVFIHASLWLWGGTRNGRGLVQTIRAVGYGSAFLNLVTAVPIIGPLAALAGWVFLAMGLARLHRTDTWRGVCAVVVTPILVCCGIYLLFFAAVIGVAAFHG